MGRSVRTRKPMAFDNHARKSLITNIFFILNDSVYFASLVRAIATPLN